MDIEYLNQELLELNLRIREAFSQASGLSKDQMTTCRWIAMNMPCSSGNLSTTQKDLVTSLEVAVEYSREHNLEEVVGWCMAAAQDECLGLHHEEREYDLMVTKPIISAFLREYLPPPARVIDVACGTGRFSLPLAAQGYDISLFDPAAPFLEMGLRKAETEGISRKVQSLICGTFTDLEKLETASHDACLCLRSILYAHPRKQAEQILYHLARIASKAVVVDVASKYGLILQLGVEFDVSANSIQQILNTGITTPAKPEHGRVVYSCFSATEFRRIAQDLGLRIHRLVGFGITETLELGTSKPIPVDEALKIESLLQNQEQMLDSFPNLLALCIKRRQ